MRQLPDVNPFLLFGGKLTGFGFRRLAGWFFPGFWLIGHIVKISFCRRAQKVRSMEKISSGVKYHLNDLIEGLIIVIDENVGLLVKNLSIGVFFDDKRTNLVFLKIL